MSAGGTILLFLGGAMKEAEEMETLAYIAGAIDGDGCVMLSKMNTTRRGVQYRPVLQLHNSSRSLPAFTTKILGGTLASDKPRKEGNRVIWKWMLQGRVGCLSALEKLIPNLIIKKDSALHLLNFLKEYEGNEGKECFLGERAYLASRELNQSRKTAPVILEKRAKEDSQDSMFWAYLAGLMDTDGSFSTGRYVRAPKKGNRQLNNLVKYKPLMQLTMVAGDGINHILKGCTLGRCYVVKAKTSQRGIAYKFIVSRREECIEFLKRIIPYLRVKINQAIMLLDFCRNYEPTKNCTAKVPEEEVLFRENCHNEIVRLNNTPS